MKYSEFLQLYEILENELSYIINEDTNLDIEETGNIFTVWGRLKRSINKVAKQVQEQIQSKVINKYLPNILNTEREIANTIAESIKQKQSKKDILKNIEKKYKTTRQNQEKQLQLIYNAIDKFIDNSSSTINKKIDSAKGGLLPSKIESLFQGGNEGMKLKLKNYWTLLEAQLKLNSYNYITSALHNDIKKILSNEESLNIYDLVSPAITATKKQTETINQEVNDKKNEIKKSEEEIKNSDSKKSNPTIGKTYKYTKKNEEEDTVEVTTVADDNSEVTVKSKKDGTSYKINKERFDKLIEEKAEDTPKNSDNTEGDKSEESTDIKNTNTGVKNQGGKENVKL